MRQFGIKMYRNAFPGPIDSRRQMEGTKRGKEGMKGRGEEQRTGKRKWKKSGWERIRGICLRHLRE